MQVKYISQLTGTDSKTLVEWAKECKHKNLNKTNKKNQNYRLL